MVTVSSSYIDELLAEIQRLRQGSRTPHTPGSVGQPPGVGLDDVSPVELPPEDPAADAESNTVEVTIPISTEGDAVRNPLQEDRPWFFPLTPELPILIGEATDAAFATRLRQELSGKSQRHFPRTQHVPDETLTSLWQPEPCPWPTPSRARFLLKVAFSTVCRRYYLVRKSATLGLLEQVVRDPSLCDTLTACKLHALFALGEAYSTRTCAPDGTLPGVGYYVSATRMLRVFSEQPRIECVEILLMLVSVTLPLVIDKVIVQRHVANRFVVHLFSGHEPTTGGVLHGV